MSTKLRMPTDGRKLRRTRRLARELMEACDGDLEKPGGERRLAQAAADLWDHLAARLYLPPTGDTLWEMMKRQDATPPMEVT